MNGTCQWLDGEPKERNFCGAKAQPGSSYCPGHHRRCYKSEKDLRDFRTRVLGLLDEGLSHSDIARALDTTKGRISGISRRHWEGRYE